MILAEPTFTIPQPPPSTTPGQWLGGMALLAVTAGFVALGIWLWKRATPPLPIAIEHVCVLSDEERGKLADACLARVRMHYAERVTQLERHFKEVKDQIVGDVPDSLRHHARDLYDAMRGRGPQAGVEERVIETHRAVVEDKR